jgi:hypothetical protein
MLTGGGAHGVEAPRSQKEQNMGATATLELPTIEDTLFGDGQVQVVDQDGDPGPDSACFCICSCRDSTQKMSASQYNNAVFAVAK